MSDIVPALIAIDWGSSSFRAFLIARDGAVCDAMATADGVASVSPGGFSATFRRLLGGWLDAHPALPVLASGMVGSRNGWREVPYAPCPAGPRDVAARLAEVEANGRRVVLAPGLSCGGETGADVMRGEETEIFGVADAGAKLIVLPGTHSKWARIEGERIMAFTTFITGELFAALRDHTIVGAFARAAAPKEAGAAFALGVERGASASDGKTKQGLLGLLFGARSLPLMGKLDPEDSGDYLSGLLIGAEIGGGHRLYPSEEPHLAGAESLVNRYLEAFRALGVCARAAAPRAAARGLFRIAQEGGLL